MTHVTDLKGNRDGSLLLEASKWKPNAIRLIDTNRGKCIGGWPTTATKVGLPTATNFSSSEFAVGNSHGYLSFFGLESEKKWLLLIWYSICFLFYMLINALKRTNIKKIFFIFAIFYPKIRRQSLTQKTLIWISSVFFSIFTYFCDFFWLYWSALSYLFRRSPISTIRSIFVLHVIMFTCREKIWIYFFRRKLWESVFLVEVVDKGGVIAIEEARAVIIF